MAGAQIPDLCIAILQSLCMRLTTCPLRAFQNVLHFACFLKFKCIAPLIWGVSRTIPFLFNFLFIKYDILRLLQTVYGFFYVFSR
ncbi:hypothetical protein GGTG_00458 [Gaeumannomyces tritici R3-111a-1]|uniref:Uncharacterized protein n=1 Tax=Gaeumannomyces tritici (strain R3-111a-1) TaxID=644352 RepID=J3NGR9_GAET3|nr:hypothetical protein GGTG_00458 [Gaeumannomyces tritici R3-111a-1]EJT80459.1 hypothetical protein GGTG_00458 [Gaeumannomyces tritici R3-111a-1]